MLGLLCSQGLNPDWLLQGKYLNLLRFLSCVTFGDLLPEIRSHISRKIGRLLCSEHVFKLAFDSLGKSVTKLLSLLI